MADYLTARAAIAEIIAGVSIQTPAVAEIEHVYQYRPDGGALNKFPSVLITGFALRYQRGASGKREKTYTIGLRLAVRPVAGSSAQMQDILEAFKEAITAAFDAATMLNIAAGGYHVTEGPNWPHQEPESDGGVMWDDGEILLTIKSAGNFAP